MVYKETVAFPTFKVLFLHQYHLAYTMGGIFHETVTTRMFKDILL